MFEKPVKLLLVEDSVDFRNMLKQYMELSGIEVTIAENGQDGLKMFRSSVFDICVLDVMMPEMDGFALGEEIRRDDSDIPLLFLTAKTRKEDRIKGLKLGADDYIVKPFDAEELLLRIRNILRRRGNKVAGEKLNIGTYALYTNEFVLEKHGKRRQLTEKESRLLEFIGRRAGTLLSRSEILEEVWGEDDYFLGRSMDVFISRLRKYLKDDPGVSIENIRGKGFVMKTEL